MRTLPNSANAAHGSSSSAPQSRRAWVVAAALPIFLVLGGCATPAQQSNSLLVTAAPEIESGSDLPHGIELARQATVADPADSTAWYWLGYGLFAQKRYGEAIPALKEALSAGASGDQYWSAVVSLGQCYGFTSDKASFQQLLKDAANVQATTAASFENKGLLFFSANMLGPAIMSFRGAIALSPQDKLYAKNLAEAVGRVDSTYDGMYRAHPSMDVLLVSKESASEVGRWRNRTLVDAKNSLVPALLRDSKTEDLEALATKVEQTILDLTHETELATDRAQRADGDSPGLGDSQRELALVYRERVALLKPILASVRDEIAGRQK